MHAFDEERLSELESLSKIDALLHFPFFANTFSLPFHYANKLLRGGRSKDQVKELLCEHKWVNDFPKLIAGKVNVFYSTTAAREEFNKSPEAEGWEIFGKVFTRYRVGFVFTEPWMIFKGCDEFSPDFVRTIANQQVDRIELLTDIPMQSQAIKLCLEKWAPKKEIAEIREPFDTLFSIAPEERSLKLYFYGAPTTTYMKSNPRQYRCLKVPDDLAKFDISKDAITESDKHSLTEICIARQKSERTTSEFCAQVLDDLQIYHNSIFEAAANEKDQLKLLSVWWAYNEFAERKQHTAIFPDPESFAKCLTEHHQPI